MPEEIGTVKKLKNNIATVIINRGEKCIGCKHFISGMDGDYMIAAAHNDNPEIKAGDLVKIASRTINQVKDGFLLFILPLLLILIAFIISSVFYAPLWGIMFAVISIPLPFIYFRVQRKNILFLLRNV